MAYSLKNFVNDHPSWQKLGRFYYKTEGNVIVSLSQRNRYFDLFFSCNIAENKQKDLQKELASVAEKYFIFDVVCVEEGVQVVFRKIEVGLDSKVEYKVATPFDQIATEIAKIVAKYCPETSCGYCHQQVGKESTLLPLAWGVAFCHKNCAEQAGELLPEQRKPNFLKSWVNQLVWVAIGWAGYLLCQCLSDTNSNTFMYFLSYLSISLGIALGQLAYNKSVICGLGEEKHHWWISIATAYVGYVIIDIVFFPFMATCWGWGGTNIGFLYSSFFAEFFVQNLLFALLFSFTGWFAYHAFDVVLNEYSDYHAKKYIRFMNKRREEIEKAQQDPDQEYDD